MKFIVQFSGGKDSLATLIWAKNNLGPNIVPIFCDTGWEHEDTYAHIGQITDQMGLELVTLANAETFVEIAARKNRFPSTKGRFCTEKLKVEPFVDYLLDHVQDNVMILQGIRSEESAARAKMSANCTFFKYYFQPYGTDRNGRERYYTYRTKEVKAWAAKYAADVVRPVFDWKVKDVFSYIEQNGFAANPLYGKGFSRVGCMPCVMARHKEVLLMKRTEPAYYQRLQDAEQEVGRTFFAPNYVPVHARSNGMYATTDEVGAYLEKRHSTLDQSDQNEPSGCDSTSFVCE